MFCYKCGKQLPDGAKFCDYCGTRIEKASQPNTVRTIRKKKKRKSRLLLPILVVTLLLVGGTTAVLLAHVLSNKESTEAAVQPSASNPQKLILQSITIVNPEGSITKNCSYESVEDGHFGAVVTIEDGKTDVGYLYDFSGNCLRNVTEYSGGNAHISISDELKNNNKVKSEETIVYDKVEIVYLNEYDESGDFVLTKTNSLNSDGSEETETIIYSEGRPQSYERHILKDGVDSGVYFECKYEIDGNTYIGNVDETTVKYTNVSDEIRELYFNDIFDNKTFIFTYDGDKLVKKELANVIYEYSYYDNGRLAVLAQKDKDDSINSGNSDSTEYDENGYFLKRTWTDSSGTNTETYNYVTFDEFVKSEQYASLLAEQ